MEVRVDYTKEIIPFKLELSPMVVTVRIINNGKLYTGKAYCSPNDMPSKIKGRKLAFTRAIAHFPREKRKKFWREYKQKMRVV